MIAPIPKEFQKFPLGEHYESKPGFYSSFPHRQINTYFSYILSPLSKFIDNSAFLFSLFGVDHIFWSTIFDVAIDGLLYMDTIIVR